MKVVGGNPGYMQGNIISDAEKKELSKNEYLGQPPFEKPVIIQVRKWREKNV